MIAAVANLFNDKHENIRGRVIAVYALLLVFIVGALTVAIAIATSELQGRFDAFKGFGGIVGTLVSALFLFAIAIANIIVLASVWRAFQTVKSGGGFVGEAPALSPPI